MLGDHCIKTWSSTQAPIALSSAEAEYYAMVESATRCLGIRTMLAELGIVVCSPVCLYADSSAARCFVARRGVGRMRHLDVRHLWLQDAVARQEVQIRRVPGEENPADLLTKYLPIEQVVHRLKGLAISWISRSLTTATEGGVSGRCSFPECDFPSRRRWVWVGILLHLWSDHCSICFRAIGETEC